MSAQPRPCGAPHRVIATLAPSSLLALLAALVLPSTAAAEAPTAERPATWDMTVEQLQEIGLGQDRGMPVPVPADAPREHTPDDDPTLHGAQQGRIFVNFDGASLSSGWDDSRTNTTQIGELAGSFAPYGAGSKRDAVLQAVIADWAPFNVIITDSRPGSGDYTMNMTGPTNPFGGGVLGIAPLDCGDSQTHNNITYAFHSANDSFSAAITATTIGQEVAHSYGLEHVDEPGDIMNPYNAGGDASFIDTCIPIVSGGQCGSQHAAECGSGTQQNSYQELMTLFGPSAPDTANPTVQITYPSDGEQFGVGASFTIMVSADDDQAVDNVTLFSNGTAMGDDGSAPYGWEVANIPEGVYEFQVIAVDTAGNEGSSPTVTITVGDAVPPPSDTGGGSDGGGSDGGGSDGGGSDGGGMDGDVPFENDSDGSLPPGYGLEDGLGDTACACRSDHSGPRWTTTALLGLLVLSIGRRRRR